MEAIQKTGALRLWGGQQSWEGWFFSIYIMRNMCPPMVLGTPDLFLVSQETTYLMFTISFYDDLSLVNLVVWSSLCSRILQKVAWQKSFRSFCIRVLCVCLWCKLYFFIRSNEKFEDRAIEGSVNLKTQQSKIPRLFSSFCSTILSIFATVL